MKSIRPIHPFPARMAPEVVWKELPAATPRLRVLDPMTGSGTTLVAARMRGHQAIGFDSDPLAVLLADTWVSDVASIDALKKAEEIIVRARRASGPEYPTRADKETCDFIGYWFDKKSRVQLTALSSAIARIRAPAMRNLMWCAFSRMIITKQAGVSLAMDVSHSRPHRKFDVAPMEAFAQFPRAVARIAMQAPFPKSGCAHPVAHVRKGDARKLPVTSGTVDMVITSPPYLNAIDYLRGHKLSLVWMGHSISELRHLRSRNVGTEVGASAGSDLMIERVMARVCNISELSARHTAMLRRFMQDTKLILAEIHRVLRTNGKAVIVVGDCNIRDVFIKNSKAFELLGELAGLTLESTRRRPIPENRRYLPPPGARGAGKSLHKRMREEVILTFSKRHCN